MVENFVRVLPQNGSEALVNGRYRERWVTS
jgi:hypothetical protein